MYEGYAKERFPERILETNKTGRASTELKSTSVASKERDIDNVAFLSTCVGCGVNKPVEITVVKMIINEPTAAVRTGKC